MTAAVSHDRWMWATFGFALVGLVALLAAGLVSALDKEDRDDCERWQPVVVGKTTTMVCAEWGTDS